MTAMNMRVSFILVHIAHCINAFSEVTLMIHLYNEVTDIQLQVLKLK